MPKVSVVMPVYNGEKYLREAIDSIINQTFTDWEFIIVNEYGSSQAATDILAEYAAMDSRIRVIQNEERLRIAESLNVGLRAAQGEYIARMDGDDVSMPSRLQRQVDYLDSHSNVDVCGLKVTMFGEGIWDWRIYSGPEYLRCATLFYTPFVHPTIMLRKSSLLENHLEYDPQFYYSEDFDFFVRASKHLNFENLPDKDLYRYRFCSDNATNVGGLQGVALNKKVLDRTMTGYGLKFSDEEITLLLPNSFPKYRTGDDFLDNLEKLDLLLKRVFLQREIQAEYGLDILFQVLHRVWLDAFEKNRWQNWASDDERISAAVQRGLFFREHFYIPTKSLLISKPKVSIVIPTFNSENYILDTIYSLLEQDYNDFEILVVNEYGSNDRTVECINLFNDLRIRILQNGKKLGLAESLNRGLREAIGEYVARADSDDVYSPNRLSKQVAFLDEHKDIAVCGSWQRHFGKRNYVHMPPTTPEEMKASLLFKCEVCHSTIMLRRDSFKQFDLWYDSAYLSEDYELWARAVEYIKFATIPEILGEYRWNGENITEKKMSQLDLEAQGIVARSLNRYLDIDIPADDLILLSGWNNPFCDGFYAQKDLRQREDVLLKKIKEQNNKLKAYDPVALDRVLEQRREWAGMVKPKVIPAEVSTQPKLGFKQKVKKTIKNGLKKFYRPFKWRYEDRIAENLETSWQIMGKVDYLQHALQDMDGHLWDYFNFLQQENKQQQRQIEHLQAIINAKQSQIDGLLVEKLAAQEFNINQAIDTRIGQTEQNINQTTDARIWQAEQNINQITDARIWQAEQGINQTTDARIWQAEKNINQTTDARIWQAEQGINQTTDARIWQAEQNINQTTDARIWQAEQGINQTTDARIWQAEQNINQTTDGRIWENEKRIIPKLDSGFWNLNYELNKDEMLNDEAKSNVYDENFYWENRYGSVMSARNILGFMLKRLHCSSMIDFGCGTGTWLWVALNYGVDEVMGLDGNYVSRSMLMIPESCFKPVDLSKPFEVPKKYDIAISLEVAEHLPAESANDFIASICKSADVVLFSAAHLGQGGDGHINEQPKEYWIERFAKHNYKPIEVKQYFADDEKVEWWYRDNIVLFVFEDKYEDVLTQINL